MKTSGDYSLVEIECIILSERIPEVYLEACRLLQEMLEKRKEQLQAYALSRDVSIIKAKKADAESPKHKSTGLEEEILESCICVPFTDEAVILEEKHVGSDLSPVPDSPPFDCQAETERVRNHQPLLPGMPSKYQNSRGQI